MRIKTNIKSLGGNYTASIIEKYDLLGTRCYRLYNKFSQRIGWWDSEIKFFKILNIVQ